MKINELKGAWLDYWVAHSQGISKAFLEVRQVPRTDDFHCVRLPADGTKHAMVMNYTSSWALSGNLLDKYRVTIDHDGFSGGVQVHIFHSESAQWMSIEGKDAREAICRAVVMVHFGQEVM